MTLVFINGSYSHIQCNICDTPAPDSATLIEKHGLAGCGWFVAGGIHRCPEHHDVECEPAAPERIERPEV